MADLAYRTSIPAARNGTPWGAIWAGVFSFTAIWSIFGLLGEAIFASSASPAAAQPVSGMSVGMGIWSVILTMIAMYVAGRVTGHFAGVSQRGDGAVLGTTMFGLTVMAAFVVILLAGTAMSGYAPVPGSAHSPYMLTVFASVGWAGFVSLLLGWFCAMGGTIHSIRQMARPAAEVRDIRNAA